MSTTVPPLPGAWWLSPSFQKVTRLDRSHESRCGSGSVLHLPLGFQSPFTGCPLHLMEKPGAWEGPERIERE